MPQFCLTKSCDEKFLSGVSLDFIFLLSHVTLIDLIPFHLIFLDFFIVSAFILFYLMRESRDAILLYSIRFHFAEFFSFFSVPIMSVEVSLLTTPTRH